MSVRRNLPFISNRAEISKAFFESGLSREEFAAKIGINVNTFGRLLGRDGIKLMYETARKIRNACGENSVMLND